MGKGYRTRILGLGMLLAIIPLTAQAGIQTTTCRPGPLPGQMVYTFFACTPNVSADELRVALQPMELSQGETIVGCSVPAGVGMSCSFTPMVATFQFPAIGPFECVPNIPGDSGKFSITIATADGVSLVDEEWYRLGVRKAGFVSVITCPPISVEDTSWGRVKAIYR